MPYTKAHGKPPRRLLPDPNANSHAGYHQWDGRGSYEVFYQDGLQVDKRSVGWYWRACFPGCLPDGDETGPFLTSRGAWVDARRDT